MVVIQFICELLLKIIDFYILLYFLFVFVFALAAGIFVGLLVDIIENIRNNIVRLFKREALVWEESEAVLGWTISTFGIGLVVFFFNLEKILLAGAGR